MSKKDIFRIVGAAFVGGIVAGPIPAAIYFFTTKPGYLIFRNETFALILIVCSPWGLLFGALMGYALREDRGTVRSLIGFLAGLACLIPLLWPCLSPLLLVSMGIRSPIVETPEEKARNEEFRLKAEQARLKAKQANLDRARQRSIDKLTASWPAPLSDAAANVLFPARVGAFTRTAMSERAEIPEVGLVLPGRHARYQVEDYYAIDVFLFHESGAEKIAATIDEKLGSERLAVSGGLSDYSFHLPAGSSGFYKTNLKSWIMVIRLPGRSAKTFGPVHPSSFVREYVESTSWED